MAIEAGIHIHHLLTNENPTLNLLMVMVLVWTTGVLCRKINQPPVLGELIAGIIFGPSVLGIIAPNNMLTILSELGVFFLMFYAGLETNPMELKKFGKLSTYVGVFGFFIPFIFGYVICKSFEMSTSTSLFISLGLSITAIAVSARVLHDLNLTRHRVTPVIIGASVIDDIVSLSLFTIIVGIGAEDTGTSDVVTVVLTGVKVLIFFIIITIGGVWIYPKIGHYFKARQSKGFTFALITALVFGILAELAGLHIIIGAYFAGLFVREGVVSKELMQKIKDRFVSITYGFLGPIFFVTLSFHVTFGIFKTHLLLITILLLGAVAGKVFGSGLGALLGRMTFRESVVIGLAMNGRGAVELVIASIGLKMGFLDDSLFSILVLIAFVTTMLPPLTIKIFLSKIKGDLGTPQMERTVEVWPQ